MGLWLLLAYMFGRHSNAATPHTPSLGCACIEMLAWLIVLIVAVWAVCTNA